MMAFIDCECNERDFPRAIVIRESSRIWGCTAMPKVFLCRRVIRCVQMRMYVDCGEGRNIYPSAPRASQFRSVKGCK